MQIISKAVLQFISKTLKYKRYLTEKEVLISGRYLRSRVGKIILLSSSRKIWVIFLHVAYCTVIH